MINSSWRRSVQYQLVNFLPGVLLIMSYELFNCTCTLMFASLHFTKGLTKRTVKIIHQIAVLLFIIGCITDAIVYTFLQKDVYLMLSGMAKKIVASTQSMLLKQVDNIKIKRTGFKPKFSPSDGANKDSIKMGAIYSGYGNEAFVMSDEHMKTQPLTFSYGTMPATTK